MAESFSTLRHNFAFKTYASKIGLNKNHKKQGIFIRKLAKNAPNQRFY